MTHFILRLWYLCGVFVTCLFHLRLGYGEGKIGDDLFFVDWAGPAVGTLNHLNGWKSSMFLQCV